MSTDDDFLTASQVEEVEASVSGQIPDWIEGALVANGGADYTGEAGQGMGKRGYEM